MNTIYEIYKKKLHLQIFFLNKLYLSNLFETIMGEIAI